MLDIPVVPGSALEGFAKFLQCFLLSDKRKCYVVIRIFKYFMHFFFNYRINKSDINNIVILKLLKCS